MRRTFGWFTALALAAAGVAIGLIAYNAGYDNGLAVHNAVQVVRYGPGFGFGFFPFLFFPLIFFVFFAFARAGRRAHWRDRAWGGHQHDEEWHRRMHEHVHDEQPTTHA